ncbi:MAG: NPCBM/NEW2 domain-containing protein [Planctomycetota bacterium]
MSEANPNGNAAPCKTPVVWILAGVLFLLATGMRVWLILTPNVGYKWDQILFAIWSRNLYRDGFHSFFETSTTCDYPPLMLLILWAIAPLASLVDPTLHHELVWRMFVRIPASLADVAVVALLFVEGKRIFGPRKALAAAALYYLNPLTLYNSAYWGQVDAIHSALLLASLVLLNRRQSCSSGALAGLALAQKLQSISILPLILLETYRLGGWRKLGWFLVGGVVSFGVVCAPFALSGVLDDVISRGYLGAVGRYQDLSRNAYNFWYALGIPSIGDTTVPPFIARIIAQGAEQFQDHGSWLFLFRWRALGLVLYGLCVALVLSVYSLRPGLISRFGAAGMLALTFFLFPTEMHERYVFPALAFLPLWAVTGSWKERVFFLLNMILLLNISAVLPAGDMSRHLAVALLLLYVGVTIWCAYSSTFGEAEERDSNLHPMNPETANPETSVGANWPFQWLRRLTHVAFILVAVSFGSFAIAYWISPETRDPENTMYLTSLDPLEAKQGWGALTKDRSVGGGMIYLGGEYFMRGLGTHAPSKLVYDVPVGYDWFEATVGVNQGADELGSVIASVEVDGKIVFTSPTLVAAGKPRFVRVPISGAKTLVLEGSPTEDSAYGDHFDWALARFVRSADLSP